MKRTPPAILEKSASAAAHVPAGNIEFFRRQIIEWGKRHRRRFPWRTRETVPIHLVLAELLLQRTRAEAVARVYPALRDRVADWSDVLELDSRELAALLAPLGLVRRRLSVLRKLASVMIQSGGRLPSSRHELESLPGIGQYVASAVLLGVHGAREPLLDSNMARVLDRFFGGRERADARDDPYLQGLARRVLPAASALEFNWAVLDFGALVCLPRQPACETCPLASRCWWFLNQERKSAKIPAF